MAKKKSEKEVIKEKSERLLEGVGYWGSFYRSNPQRFVKDYLNIKLKTFQKILIWAMMMNNYYMHIASRGQGKTWLTALFCVVRCILYPGSKIVIASGVKSQAIEVLLKITDDFMKNYEWGSINLRNEISFYSTGQNEPKIEFKNGSFIVVKTANDNARSARANIIVVDEFRMVNKKIIDTVLRKFLTAPRSPGYLNNPKYAHLAERNKELYMSSAWYKDSWCYDKVTSFFTSMMDDAKKYFVCALPYQLAIKENLLSREQIEDEMSENDFDPVAFSMEMECLFYGQSNGAFFKYDEISKQRRLKNSFYPLSLYQKKNIDIPKLMAGERRILSVDVALLASKKNDNDASSLIINSAIPTDEINYISNVVYIQNYEGLTTDQLGIIIMRTFYEYKCTDLVVDTNGIGLGVFDYIIKDQFDIVTGNTYKAFNCINDDVMAERCHVKDANKCMWSIKGNANFNSEACVLLRNGFQNSRINLLCTEYESEDPLSQNKIYTKSTSIEQAMFKTSYVQTSLLINELINLNHEIRNGNIKIFEKSGMRKDRYSSLAYNYWVLNQIINSKKPRRKDIDDLAEMLSSATVRSSRKYGMFDYS